MKLTKEKVANYILQQVCLDDKELYSGISNSTRIWTQIGSDAEGGVEPAVDIEVFEDKVVVIGENNIELPFPKTMKELKELTKKINIILIQEYDRFMDVGIVLKMKYFVFNNMPRIPNEIVAIFNNKKQAEDFVAEDFVNKNFYFIIRKAEWTDGKLPTWNECKS